MSWLENFFGSKKKTQSANIAKDRLSVLIASDNALRTRLSPAKIDNMKREIADVVNKYVDGVSINDVNINHRSQDDLDVLQMNINLSDD